MPINVANFQVRAPTPQDMGLAVSQVPGVAANANLAQVVAPYGFMQASPDQFISPDGSWIARDTNGRIQRGVGTVMFQGIPRAAPQQPAAPPPPVQQPVINPQQNPNGIPSMQWAYYQQFKIGQLPIMDYNSCHAVAAQHGFTASAVGGGTRYSHPDGTWLQVVGASLQLGWQQWHLGQLPYNGAVRTP